MNQPQPQGVSRSDTLMDDLLAVASLLVLLAFCLLV